MAHARNQHPNAPLTPQRRRRMVSLVLEGGWTVESTAERFQVDAKTVRKWRDRFVAEGDGGLFDRSSRPKRSTNRTRPGCVAGSCSCVGRVVGAPIGSPMSLTPSTVQSILNAAGCGRLDRGDRATREPVVRAISANGQVS